MDELKGLIPVWKQIYYKFKSIRTIPFRKKFFIGYDLKGNTYWEFNVDRRTEFKARRIYQPYKQQEFIYDYFNNVPIQWLQWLRYTRVTPPTIKELMDDEKRQNNLKTMVDYRALKQSQSEEEAGKAMSNALNKELKKLEREKMDKLFAQNQAELRNQKEAESNAKRTVRDIKLGSDNNVIQNAHLKVKRRGKV